MEEFALDLRAAWVPGPMIQVSGQPKVPRIKQQGWGVGGGVFVPTRPLQLEGPLLNSGSLLS